MNKPVGIPGPGIMSGTIARNLVDRGWYIIGFNIDPARQTELAEAASPSTSLEPFCAALAPRPRRYGARRKTQKKPGDHRATGRMEISGRSVADDAVIQKNLRQYREWGHAHGIDG